MRQLDLNSNEQRKTTTKISVISLLSIILAFTLAACSFSTKLGDTKTSESNPAGNENSTVRTPERSTNGDLGGSYAVKGIGPDGSTYQGEVIVTKRDAVYQMSWKVGRESYDGVAVQDGNTLAAAYTTGASGKGCGAVIYKINSDNSLDGKWGEWGVNSTGTEKAAPVGQLNNSVGVFSVSGSNADGSDYTGKLTVTKSGNEVYQFAWETGSKFVGTGVKMGEYLAAGSGSKQCGFVIYEIKGETLQGKWGVPGSTALGTETAAKK